MLSNSDNFPGWLLDDVLQLTENSKSEEVTAPGFNATAVTKQLFDLRPVPSAHNCEYPC